MAEHDSSDNRNQSSDELIGQIFDALRKAGRDPERLSPDDVTEIGELHIRGRQATLELAQLAGLTEGINVLDVGSGIGAPAFALAHHFDCNVTGIDVTEAFCRIAELLCERMGLQDKVQIRHSSALDMPFEDDSFDVAWLQHVGMSIGEKDRLFAEIARVLRPEGKLALYEVCLGPEGDVVFPVPWARGPEQNFLATPDELQELLKAAGFAPLDWQDDTDVCLEFGRQFMKKVQEEGPPPLNQGVIVGPGFGLMAMNYMLNLNQNRIRVIRAVMVLN